MRALAIAAIALPFVVGCNVLLGFGSPGNAESDLRLSITPGPIGTSQFVPFNVTVTNQGPDDAFDVLLAISVPSGSALSDPRCSPDCRLGVLAAGDTSVAKLAATPSLSPLTASVSTSSNEVDTTNNRASVLLAGNADLELQPLITSPDQVPAGQVQSYTFRVYNHGPTAATSIKLDFSSTPGFLPQSVSGPGWGCEPLPCRLDLALPNAYTYSVTWSALSPVTPGQAQVTGKVSADTTDPVSSNNSTTYTKTVITNANLAVALHATPDPVAPSGTLTYSTVVSNTGPSTVTAVKATQTLPSGATFVDANGPGWMCSLAGQDVTCTLATLAIGNAPPITTIITAPATAGTITSSATVTAAHTETSPTDNTASLTTTVGP